MNLATVTTDVWIWGIAVRTLRNIAEFWTARCLPGLPGHLAVPLVVPENPADAGLSPDQRVMEVSPVLTCTKTRHAGGRRDVRGNRRGIANMTVLLLESLP